MWSHRWIEPCVHMDLRYNDDMSFLNTKILSGRDNYCLVPNLSPKTGTPHWSTSWNSSAIIGIFSSCCILPRFNVHPSPAGFTVVTVQILALNFASLFWLLRSQILTTIALRSAIISPLCWDRLCFCTNKLSTLSILRHLRPLFHSIHNKLQDT